MAVYWKKQAEDMLSQYMEGGGIIHSDNYAAPTSSYFLPENFSKPDTSNCVDSLSDFLLLGQCNCLGLGDSALDRPCRSLFMQWVKLSIGRAVKAYLASPLLLALMPLALGVAIGYYFGPRNSSTTSRMKAFTFFGRVYSKMISYCYYCLPHHQMPKSVVQTTTTKRESGVELECVPRHIAVIMDGNRRYGREKYGSVAQGHADGGKRLLEFANWCVDEEIKTLTVYAFSTENWNRSEEEIAALKSVFITYCDKILEFANKVGARINILSTDRKRVDEKLKEKFERLQNETKQYTNFTLNICMSYSGRNEIVNACKSIAVDVQSGKVDVNDIGEAALQKKMLTNECCDPDIIMRTSGEERISNFLLWQCAYSEFFFLEKRWPELQKSDLLDVIRTFAHGRQRRFGK